MKLGRAQLAGRAGWTVADQVLSATSNLALSIVVARSLDAEAFGAFAVAFVVFGVAVAVERALVGQPLQIKHSAESREGFRRLLAEGSSAALAIGLLFAVGCVSAGLILGGALAQALVPLGVLLPALLLQDVARMAWFALREPREATFVDLVWNVGLVAALLVAIPLGQGTLPVFMLAWGGSAAVSAVVGWGRLGVRPSLRGAWRWVSERRRLCGFLLAEYVVGLGAAQVAILVTGVIAGAREVGSLRGAQVALGPLQILGAAAFAFAIPELSRRAHLTPRSRIRAGAALSLVMGLAGTLYLGAALLVPDPLGHAAFGETWAGARAVLLAMGIASLAAGLGAGPGAVLYSMGRADLTFRLHAVKAPVLVIVVSLGAHRGGASGAALALAACEVAMLPAWVWTAYRAARASGRQESLPDGAQPLLSVEVSTRGA